jgi:hypothetical protein
MGSDPNSLHQDSAVCAGGAQNLALPFRNLQIPFSLGLNPRYHCFRAARTHRHLNHNHATTHNEPLSSPHHQPPTRGRRVSPRHQPNARSAGLSPPTRNVGGFPTSPKILDTDQGIDGGIGQGGGDAPCGRPVRYVSYTFTATS